MKMFKKLKIKKKQKNLTKNRVYCLHCRKLIGYEHFYCRECETRIPHHMKIEPIIKEYISRHPKLKGLELYQLEVSIRYILSKLINHQPRRKQFYNPLEIRSIVFNKIETGLTERIF